MSDPNAQSWFHGRISREESEKLLKSGTVQNGKYLLRESTAQLDTYVLSVCYDGNIVHYQILRNRDGTVGIADGLRYPGPVELVHHHEVNLDGLLTRLSVQCQKPQGVKAKVYQNVTHDDLEEATRYALYEAAGIEVSSILRGNCDLLSLRPFSLALINTSFLFLFTICPTLRWSLKVKFLFIF